MGFIPFLIPTGQAEAQASAPNVTATQPRHGEQNVPVDLKEIAISFDQDMDPSGYSFIGGGPSFPKVAGKPSWRGPRECVLPVKLEAGQAYSLGINGATQTGFKSARGIAATPSRLEFKTRAASGIAAAATIPARAQAESVRQLREAIEHRYSYREVHAVDWPAAWRQFEPRLLAAQTAREFAVVAGEMLASTNDAHIWLLEAGEVIPAFRRTLAPNVNVSLLPRLIGGWTQKHPMVASGRAAPGIGYVAIHSWEKKYAPQLLEAAFSALTELQELPALIVDVRGNSGGDEIQAREFAGCFVRVRALYARHVNLDGVRPGGFSAPFERWLEPTPNRPAYAGRVVVLMGSVNMSSAEAFLLMMRQGAKTQLIGERSFGASGNPQPHLLANGVTVYLPSWKAMLPDGAEFEGRGIAPDLEIKATSDDFAKRDLLLERAVELLRK